ncbi:hypothetical protein B0H12DRAFT_1329413 [Mycena haematopus]|nr:hypothetical protein B0H12DRAFT_1329413 [Mycena haematopus]
MLVSAIDSLYTMLQNRLHSTHPRLHDSPQPPTRISFQTTHPTRLPPALRLEKFDLVPAYFLVIPPRAVASTASGTGADDAGRRGSMVPVPGVDVPPPTLLDAALHVDTTTSSSGSGSGTASPQPAAAEDEQSVSPPGLEGTSAAAAAGADTTTARRYGRSRTDTMRARGASRRAPRAPPRTTGAWTRCWPRRAWGAPASLERSTSDDEPGTGTGGGGEMGPVASPSSSTALQAESHPIMSMLEREDVPGRRWGRGGGEKEGENVKEEERAVKDEERAVKEEKQDEGGVKEEVPTEAAEPAKESEVAATKEGEEEAATPVPVPPQRPLPPPSWQTRPKRAPTTEVETEETEREIGAEVEKEKAE